MIRDPEDSDATYNSIAVPATARIAIIIGIAAMLGTGIFMGPFYDWAAEAANSLTAMGR